ncbi:MAG: hypothetical protein L0Z55_00145, partial [Planctomycetes bacterium]|nr:hypothetical protein [Planctomycetota bacterium]
MFPSANWGFLLGSRRRPSPRIARFVGIAALAALFLGGGVIEWRARAAAGSTASLGLPGEIALCRQLEEWIPASYAAIVKLHRLGDELPALLDSALYEHVLRFPQVQEALAGAESKKFLEEIAWLGQTTKKEPLELARALLGREIALALRLDGARPVYLFLTRAASAGTLAEIHEAIKGGIVARFGAWPFPIGEARGATQIFGAGEFYYALLGEVFAASNDLEAMRAVADLASGGGGPSIRAAPECAGVLAALGPEHLAAAALRNLKALPHEIPARAENFVASLLGGGWLEALRESTLLTATLDRAPAGAASLTVRCTAAGLAARGAAFLAAAPRSAVATAFEERGFLGLVELKRDLALFWRQGEKLIEPKGFGE